MPQLADGVLQRSDNPFYSQNMRKKKICEEKRKNPLIFQGIFVDLTYIRPHTMLANAVGFSTGKPLIMRDIV